VHDECAATGPGERGDEVAHEAEVRRAIDPEAVLDRDGSALASRIARTQSATSSGSAIRHAPKAPRCTRSLGQPTFRFTSS
jgi:hypothetical protein